MKISEMITDRYKLRIPPTVYYELLADVQEMEEEQEPSTKNNPVFCPDRKAKTTHMETFLHCVEDECVAYKDGKCIKYNSDQEPTTKNDLGVEYISRSELMAILSDYYDTTVEYRSMLKEIAALPSVAPQEPKTGHWIDNECTNCGYEVQPWNNTNYCPNCGAKMVEPQESEDV